MPGKSFFKSLALFLLASLLLGIVILSFIPTIASTQWGKNQILKVSKLFIPGSIDYANANFSWTQPQFIEGLTIKDPEGINVLKADSISTDCSLLKLFFTNFCEGTYEFKGLNANLIEEAPGVTNLQMALGKKVSVESLGKDKFKPLTILLNNTEGKVHIDSKKENLSIHLLGHTKHDDLAGLFDVNILLNDFDLHDGIKGLEESQIELKANVTNFPVALIDHLIAVKHPELTGLAQTLLGKTLDINLSKTFIKSGISFDLAARSPLMTANLSGQLQSQKLILNPDGKINLTITPELVDYIAKIQNSSPSLQLAEATSASINIQQFVYPLETQELSAVIEAFIPSAEIKQKKLPIPLKFSTIVASLNAAENSKNATITIKADSVQGNQKVPLELQAILDKPIKLNEIAKQFLKNSKVKVRINSFPLAVIEDIYDLDGLLVNYLGNKASVDLNGTFTENSMAFNINLNGELLEAKNVSLQKTGNNWDLSAQLLPIEGSFLHLALGKLTSLKSSLKNNAFDALIESDLLSLAAKGRLSRNEFELAQPLSLKYKATPQLIAALGMDKAKLKKTASIELIVSDLSKNFDLDNISSNNLDDFFAKGEFKIDDLSIADERNSASIQNFKSPWEFNFAKNSIKVDFKGNTQLAGNSQGLLNGKITINKWWKDRQFDFSNALYQSNIIFENIPSIVLSSLSNIENLENILGKTININLNANGSPSIAGKNLIELAISGEQVKGNLAISISDSITLANSKSPSGLEILITPEKYAFIRSLIDSGKSDSQGILEPVLFKATLNSINIPLNNKAPVFAQAGLETNISMNSLKLFDPSRRQSILLDDITAKIESKNLSRQIAFNITAKDKSLQNYSNDWIFNGSIVNAFNQNGKLNLDDLSLDLVAKSNRFPASLFCHMACIDNSLRNKLEALLGHTIDTDISVQLQRMHGPIQLKLKGENGRIFADAMLANNALTLNRPLEIEVEATPQLGKSILQDVIPILSGVKSAEKPIKITIDPQGFILPIKNIDIAAIQVGSAVVDLGKIEFSNSGELANILSLLRPPANENLKVWFTPLYLQMKNGNLVVNRMDMLLLNQYPISIWGKINFPKDKVDLMFGITGAALNNALGLKVDPSEVLQLPFQGKIGEATIDKTNATTRISSLVAQNQGSPQGVIIGTVLDIAGGSFGEKDPPKPTTNPLPWQSMMQPKTSETSSSSKKPKKDKTAKYIESGAKLIDSLLSK